MAQQLVASCLNFDERARPNAADLRRHAWFQQNDPTKTVNLTADMVKALTKEREGMLWWRAMTSVAAAELPAAKIAHLTEAFRTLDADKTGQIKKAELTATLVSHGIAWDVAGKAADAADIDNSGFISWSEFVAALLPASHELFATSLQLAFSHFDINNDGHLDRDEITALLSSGQIDRVHIPDSLKVQEMIEEIDVEGKGLITFQDFHAYFINADQTAIALSGMHRRSTRFGKGLNEVMAALEKLDEDSD